MFLNHSTCAYVLDGAGYRNELLPKRQLKIQKILMKVLAMMLLFPVQSIAFRIATDQYIHIVPNMLL